MRKLLLVLLCLSPLGVRAGSLAVYDAWIRHIPGDRPMAGYFVVDNQSGVDRSLVGTSSPAFGAVQIHRTVVQDGMAGMQPVESVALPAEGRVEFAPGGYHLMLMRRQQEVRVGDRVPVLLEFENGEGRTVIFTVKPAWTQ